MIDKKARKVVIINNINSDTIDQAIFILKTELPNKSCENHIVEEAQKIIDSYVRQVERLKTTGGHSAKSRHRNSFLSTLLTISCTAAFMLTVFFFAVYNM